MPIPGALTPSSVIGRKRDGFALNRGEIASFVQGATDGSWADYQLSAMLMAIFIVRTVLEDGALWRELPGYKAYCTRARYRLVPGVW